MRSFSRRLLLTLLPAALLVWVAASAIWGPSGLLARHQLAAQLRQGQDELARIDRENQRLLRDLRAMDQDPVVVERMVAEELHWGRPDAVLIRFEEPR